RRRPIQTGSRRSADQLPSGMPHDTARRRSLLTTALVDALLPKDVPEGHMVRAWLDSWAGIGPVAAEMPEVGYNRRRMRTVFGWGGDFCRAEQPQLIRRFEAAEDRQAPGGPSSGRRWRRYAERGTHRDEEAGGSRQ